MKTMAVSEEIQERLKKKKKHERQPYYEVIGEILDKLEEYEKKEKE